MKRKGRKILAGIFGVIAVIALATIETLDFRPYLRAGYFLETKQVLEQKAATNETIIAQLKAGFGKALLTPTVGAQAEDAKQGRFVTLPMAGYGARKGKSAQGVHDDLFVKAVALQVGSRLGVMLSADALIIPREVADAAASQLRAEANLDREQIYFSATHTHCSIGGWGEGYVGQAFAGKFNPAARIWFAQQLVRAAREAIADLQPAEFGHAKFAARDFVRNRVTGDLGKVDADFSLALIQRADGKRATLGAFAAHATVLSASVMEFSGDYPGYWQRAVEERTGGMAMFLSGGVGSHAPTPGAGGFEGAERMGKTLAERTVAATQNAPMTNRLPFSIFGATVRLPELHVRVTERLRLRPWVARQLVPVSDQTYLQGFRIGDALWISTPCDFSGELALALKHRMTANGFAGTITSFNGDYVGYVVPGKYYHLGGYEPRVMSFFGPTLTDYLLHLIQTIETELCENPKSTNVEAK